MTAIFMLIRRRSPGKSFFCGFALALLGLLSLAALQPVRLFLHQNFPGLFNIDPGRSAILAGVILAAWSGEAASRVISSGPVIGKQRLFAAFTPFLVVTAAVTSLSMILLVFRVTFEKIVKDNSFLLYLLKLQEENEALLNVPSVRRMLLVFALAALAMFLARSTGINKAMTALAITLVLGVDLLPWAIRFNPFITPDRIELPAAHRTLMDQHRNPGHRSIGLDRSDSIRPESEVFPPNSLLLFGIPDFRQYSSTPLASGTELIRHVQNGRYWDRTIKLPLKPLLDLASVKYFYTMPQYDVRPEDLTLSEHLAGMNVYVSNGVFPRLRLTGWHRSAVRPGEDGSEPAIRDIWSWLEDNPERFIGSTILSGVEDDHWLSGIADTAGGEISSVSWSDHQIEATVETRTPALAVLSDSWYPGWTATVNGDIADVLQGERDVQGGCGSRRQVDAGDAIPACFLPAGSVSDGNGAVRSRRDGSLLQEARSVRMKNLLSCLLSLGLFTLCGVIAFAQVEPVVEGIALSETQIIRETPVVRAVRKVESAVVNISTEKVVSVRGFNPFGDDWIFEYFGQENRMQKNVTRQSLGSGVLIREDGTILTNEHVILPASKITVTLADGRDYEAELMGASRRFDLALLKIDAGEPLPFVPPGKSDDLMIGETVIAIGNPYGLASTVTTGVISAKNRTVTFQDPDTRQTHVFHDFLQTDASINPGNSGGPLLNILGELIGINTAIFDQAQGIGFAIPIDKAARIIDDLLEWGDVPRIWVGLHVQDLTSTLAQHFDVNRLTGVLVSEVRKDSPAESSGLRPGDLIVAVGNSEIKTTGDYRLLMRNFTPGDSIGITYFRGRREMKCTLEARAVPLDRVDELAWDSLGVQFRAITREDIQSLNLYVTEGVLVTDVRMGSPAADVGIRQGDVIARLNRVILKKVDDLNQLMPLIVQQDSVMMVVVRGSNAYRVNVMVQ